MKLKFTIPIDYNSFSKNHGQKANAPGIYIWGFLNNNKFVPYYVGKSENNIHARILSHFKKLHINNTYTIFNNEFYKNLPKNMVQLPRVAIPDKHLLSISGGHFLKNLLYKNDSNYLNTAYASLVTNKNLLSKELTSQALDGILINKKNKIQDTINTVFSANNLYISYATPNIEQGNIKQISFCETATKFCLIANTISRSQSINKKTIPSVEISSINNYLSSCFHHALGGKSSIDCTNPKNLIYYGYK